MKKRRVKKRPRARALKREPKYVDAVRFVDDYLGMLDWRVRENANVPYSFSSMFLQAAGETVTRYTLSKVYPREISQAHIEGDFHIHNLPFGVVGYCSGWSIRDLLLQGFSGVPGRTESSPPRHFSSALLQISNFMGSIQNEWAGAQAVNSLDVYLAPFVRKDELSYKQVKQAMQEFIYNLNISSRWGGQTPFTNITFELKVPEDMRNEPVIYGGGTLDETYADYQPEIDLINRAFLDVMHAGDMRGRVFTFPIPTFNVTKDFDWDSDVSDLLFQVTAKFGIPYFQNCIKGGIDPREVRAMCLHPDEPILAKIDERIQKTTIGELVEAYADRWDGEWSKPTRQIETLSLDPNGYRIRWSPIYRFFRTRGDKIYTVETRDGKVMHLSADHPVAVYTPDGIKTKRTCELQLSDLLLVTRKLSQELFGHETNFAGYSLDEDLAFFLGLFLADGVFVFETRKELNTCGQERGIQISFNANEKELMRRVGTIIERIFGKEMIFVKDKRYPKTVNGRLWSTEISRGLSRAGLKKGKVPDVLFNAPANVMKAFLDGFFAGDGYVRGREIHINDRNLAKDLLLLYAMVGIPTTFRDRGGSQVIRIQHMRGRGSMHGRERVDILYNRVPQYTVRTSKTQLFYNKNCLVGRCSIEKHNAHTEESKRILDGDFVVVKINSISTKENMKQVFYDFEIDRDHYFVHSMGQITHNCCRLVLDLKELHRRHGGFFGYSDKVGSIGVVTINMPRLGYLSKDEDKFFERLEGLMELAKDSLEIKRKLVTENMKRGLLPFSARYLGTLKFHFSTIGLVGMHEACLNFLGEGIETKASKGFAMRVLKFMRERLVEFQDETGNVYNLEATPAEGTSHRLARLDKKRHPKIITAGKKVPYYTNSTHLPVGYTNNLIEALRHQDDLQVLYNGGTILHGFLGEAVSSAEGCKVLVRRIAENFRLPYYTITPTFSICMNHGYLHGEHFKCPRCGKPAEVYSRIVGYYRPIANWHVGKREEFKDRLEYDERVSMKEM